MLGAILAFFQAVPAITGGINNFVNKYYDAKVQLTAARVGGDVAVAKAIVGGVVDEGKVRVSFLHEVASNKWLMILVYLYAFPIAVWFNKCILWDKVLEWGTTDPLTGQVATIANIVVSGIFGGATVMGAMSIYGNWRKSQ